MVRDHRDELNILSKILEEQKHVIDKAFCKSGGLGLEDEAREYYMERTGLDARIGAVKRMKEDTTTTYDQVRWCQDKA